jgi:hypothetical protein
MNQQVDDIINHLNDIVCYEPVLPNHTMVTDHTDVGRMYNGDGRGICKMCRNCFIVFMEDLQERHKDNPQLKVEELNEYTIRVTTPTKSTIWQRIIT